MKSFEKDLLKVNIYSSRDEMGTAAAGDVKAAILRALAEKETINMNTLYYLQPYILSPVFEHVYKYTYCNIIYTLLYIMI